MFIYSIDVSIIFLCKARNYEKHYVLQITLVKEKYINGNNSKLHSN